MRKADYSDIPALIHFAKAFFEYSGYGDYVTFSANRMRQVLRNLIDSDDGVVFICEAGFCCAVMHQNFFTQDWVAHELCWWVDPDRRAAGFGRELRAHLEQWAKEKGAAYLVMSSLDFGRGDKVGPIYVEAGYTPAEHAFIRSF